MPPKVNKGEWAELFVFLKVLSEGKIYAADEELNKISTSYYTVLSALKEENNRILEYFRNTDNVEISIYANDEKLISVPISVFNYHADILLDEIKKNTGTFEIPILEDFLMNIGITKIKANSATKRDITLKIHDEFTKNQHFIGFSIKSYIGSKPTLLNASNATKLRFKITKELTLDEINEINSISSRKKIMDRIDMIKSLNSNLRFDSIQNSRFKRNLQMIDYRFPEIFSNLFYCSYFVPGKSIKQVVEYYCEKFEEDNELIEYKMKDLLVAIALGMEPNTKWDGIEEANGGYIVVKNNGDILCYHIYDRNRLKEYLYRNTKFDSPSSSRTNAGIVISEEDGQYFYLTSQIRF